MTGINSNLNNIVKELDTNKGSFKSSKLLMKEKIKLLLMGFHFGGTWIGVLKFVSEF